MRTLKVSEMFLSLQGEGARAGEPSTFIRLSGCDLACSFCDTEFESGEDHTLAVIKEAASVNGVPWIVWTGGEPALQLTDEDVAFFKAAGFKQAIETNGGHRVPNGLDWVACSPKVAEHVLEKSFPNGVDELRYVRHAGQPGIPKPRIAARRKFLSPMCDGNKINKANLQHCMRLCIDNPEWTLSLQMHKVWGVL